jgi:hypothetical protein
MVYCDRLQRRVRGRFITFAGFARWPGGRRRLRALFANGLPLLGDPWRDRQPAGFPIANPLLTLTQRSGHRLLGDARP